MAFVFGTSTNYQTFADVLSDLAIGTSLQDVTAVAGGGTGYTVGDILTVSGGTSTVAATIEVLTAPAGVIATVRVRNAGLYQTTPGNPASVTGGTGSGATFTLDWDTNGWTRLRATNVTGAAQSATIAAGGSGYVVGDILTLSGGTSTIPATFRVTSAPSGIVAAVTVVEPGSYTSNPGNPVATTGGTGTLCTLTVTFGGSGEREVILEGVGSGSDEIIIGYRSYNDSGSGARNIVVNGFTGFDTLLSYENQPGRSPGLDTASGGADSGGAFVPLTNATITWWISVTPRRIIAVAKTGTCYASLHAGFLNPFATAGEWPYPLYIAGSTTQRFRLPSTSTITTSGIADPIADGTNEVGPGFLRAADGTWYECQNSRLSGGSRSSNTQGVNVSPVGNLSGVTLTTANTWFNRSGAGADIDIWGGSTVIPNTGQPGTASIRLLRTTNSGGDLYCRIPCTVIRSNGNTAVQIAGELDGVSWFSTAAAGISAENRLTDGSQRFTVFQGGTRTDEWALWALEER